MKILYIEDNKADADLTKMQLAKDIPDCKISIVSSLQEAKDKLFSENPFELLLIDMNLPDGSGLDLLVELRQKELSIPIIVLTGTGDEESAVAALKAGADDYLIKKQGYLLNLYKTIEFVLNRRNENLANQKQILRVLYTEHNSADIDLTKRHLSKYAPNIQLTICNTVDELMEIINNNHENYPYDVLLTDYSLTGLNGLDLIKIIREIKRIPLAIVMVTGQGDEEIAIQALRLGADEYLVKKTNYLFRLPSMILSAYQRHELEKKQAALQQSEERFRRLAENAQDIIYRYEFIPVSRFTYVSPAATKITGYTPEEHYTDPDLGFKLVHPDDVHLLKNATKSYEGPLVLRWIKKDKTVVWTEQSNVPIFDESGNLVALEGIARDITERMINAEKLAEEKQLLRTVIDNLPDNVYVKDTKMRKVLVNKADLDIIGKSEEEVIGKDDNELFDPEIAASFITDDKLVLEKGQSIINREEIVLNRHGKKTWLLTSKLPLRDNRGKIIGMVGIGHNITERKLAEELLQEREKNLKEKNEEYQKLNSEYLILNEELTETINHVQNINEELLKSKKKAEESDRLKTAFLANMSHEIRTPMNAIMGFTQILRQTGIDSDKREHFMDLINSSSERLLSVVNDIISISKIESGIIELSYSNIKLNELMNILYNHYIEPCKNKNISLILNSPDIIIQCNTDGAKLHQVLSNLIDNAIKFTETGSIILDFNIRKQNIYFSVKDTGIGIDEQKQKIVFERFRQADEKNTRRYGGIGLGLAIAKAYVTKLGGEIWLESIQGKGTTINFYIPHLRTIGSELSQEENLEKNIEEIDWSGRRILIVEDDITNYEYLIEVLKPTRIIIYHAKNGEEAIDLFQKNNPELILMDIKLPKMDGYEATRIIRQKNKEIPIVAFTAYALDVDKTKAVNIGFNDHVSKPFSVKTLLSVLNFYL